MFKKIAFVFLLAFSVSYGAWSQPALDNIAGELAELVTNTVGRLNSDTMNKYNSEIKPLIQKIKVLAEKKKKLLAEIQALEKEKSVNESQAAFLLYQEKNLLGNYSSIISVEEEKEQDE